MRFSPGDASLSILWAGGRERTCGRNAHGLATWPMHDTDGGRGASYRSGRRGIGRRAVIKRDDAITVAQASAPCCALYALHREACTVREADLVRLIAGDARAKGGLQLGRFTNLAALSLLAP